jgi:hypothetical protein
MTTKLVGGIQSVKFSDKEAEHVYQWNLFRDNNGGAEALAAGG